MVSVGPRAVVEIIVILVSNEKPFLRFNETQDLASKFYLELFKYFWGGSNWRIMQGKKFLILKKIILILKGVLDPKYNFFDI